MNMLMPGRDPAADEWVAADACTLPTAEQPLRVAEFDDLFATGLRSIEYPNGSRRARLVFDGEDDLADRVQRLADAETSCCSFFTFTLTPRPTDDPAGVRLALDIEVPAARAGVLAALVRRAEHARGPAS